MKNLLTAAFIGTCLIGATTHAMEIAAPALEASVLLSSKPDLGQRGYDLQTAKLTFTNVPPHLQNKTPEELRLLAAKQLLAMEYEGDKTITLDMSKCSLSNTPPVTTSTFRKILVNGLMLTAGVGAGYLIATKTKAGE